MAGINTKLDADQVIKQAYDETNQRLRVDAAVSASISDIVIEDIDGDKLGINPDGSINTNIINAINVEINAADGDNVAISDGTDTLAVNPDGSINVNTIDSTVVNNQYAEVTGVVNGVPTTVLNYTLPSNKKLQIVSASGTNIAMYELLIDSVVVAKQYTNFGSELNVNFNMNSLTLNSGQNIRVVVTHNRPYVGNFNTNIILKG